MAIKTNQLGIGFGSVCRFFPQVNCTEIRSNWRKGADWLTWDICTTLQSLSVWSLKVLHSALRNPHMKMSQKQVDMFYRRITSWVQCTLGLDREVRGLCELIRKCVIELRDMREIWISDWSQSLCSAPRPSRPASPSGWIRSGTGSHGFLVSGTALSGAGWSVVSTL